MPWLDEALDQLAAAGGCPYHQGGLAATEPTAWAAMALAAHERHGDADAALDWLAAQQAADGSLGVALGEPFPTWPTSLAVLAWSQAAARGPSGLNSFQRAIEAGLTHVLAVAGRRLPRTAATAHDTTLVGWPWVEGTHSWIEPTAYPVLALKATGRSDHPRTREAVRLLIDRLLPEGGCNYGNTFVLGQKLRGHVQPTAAAVLALQGEPDADGRIARSVEFLAAAITAETTPTSLAFALMGLAAYSRIPPEAEAWLSTAAAYSLARGSSYELALLALAASGRLAAPVRVGRRESAASQPSVRVSD